MVSRTSSFAVVRTSLLATLLAAPLAFGAVQPWAWGAMAVAAFLLLLFLSFASARQGRIRILWSPLYIPVGFIFLLGMIQFAGHLTMDFIATREGLLKLSTDLILFFLAGQLFAAQSPGPILGNDRELSGGLQRREEHNIDILSSPRLRWTLVLYTSLLAL